MSQVLRLFLSVSAVFFICSRIPAQLCNGSLGDPVVKITFGSGTNPGPQLTNTYTNYVYTANDCPDDGYYTIRNQTNNCFGATWHSLNQDHTGDPNGYFMLINASFAPSDFYLQTVNGLCGNTTYEFAAWILNMIRGIPSYIKPNITFSIEKQDGTVLQSFNTGDIGITPTPQWNQYGFFFTTPPNTTTVVIRMKNNAPGGNGNDLALDDITFRPCGPQLTASIAGLNGTAVNNCADDRTVYTFNAVVSSGYNAPVYIWQISTDSGNTWQDIPGAVTTTYVRGPTSGGKYLYRMAVAETGNGSIAACRIASNTISVNVNPLPVITVNANSPVCEGTGLDLHARISFFSKQPWLVNWTYPDPAPVILTTNIQNDTLNNVEDYSETVKAVLGSAGKYYLNVQNSYGCSAKDSISAVIHKKPIGNFSVSPTLCAIKSVSFSDASLYSVPLSSWAWTFGDGGTSTLQNPAHVFTVANNYAIGLVVTDMNGCKSDTTVKDIVVHALPYPDFILPEICLTDPFADFKDSSSISDHSEAGFSYAWDFGDPVNPPNTSVVKNPQHKYIATGYYNIHLIVASKDGCISDTTKLFTVNGAVPKAMFTITNSGNICSNDSVRLLNTATVNFGNIVKTEIFWDDLNSPALETIDRAPFPGKIYKFDYSALVDAPKKNFRVRYVAYSGISCVSQTFQDITIYRQPVVQFNQLPQVCLNSDPFLIIQAGENSGAVGVATFSGDGVTGNGLFNPMLAGAGSHNLLYTFISSDGCKASQGQVIQINPLPQVDAGPDRVVVKGATIILHPNVSGAGLTYSWSPVMYLDDPKALTPKVTPQAGITYRLTVTSADGCANIDSMYIKVLNGLYVPGGFTPNGDGLNDIWKIPGIDSYPGAEVWVFNRWGQLVYHVAGQPVSWNGMLNGKPQASGTYVYLVDLKTGAQKIKGVVILIR